MDSDEKIPGVSGKALTGLQRRLQTGALITELLLRVSGRRVNQ